MRLLELFNFEELSTEAQQKVINYNRDILTENGEWSQQIKEHTTTQVDRLSKIGFKNATIWQFILEGAFFTCTEIDVKSLLKHYGEYERFQHVIAGYAAKIDQLPNVNHRLESTACLTVISQSSDKFVPALSAFIMDMARQEMRKIFRELKASYDHCRSDQAVRQALIDCCYEYTITGDKVEIE